MVIAFHVRAPSEGEEGEGVSCQCQRVQNGKSDGSEDSQPIEHAVTSVMGTISSPQVLRPAQKTVKTNPVSNFVVPTPHTFVHPIGT